MEEEKIIKYASELNQMRAALETAVICHDVKRREEQYSLIMAKARELGIEADIKAEAIRTAEEFKEPELWELPEPFDKSTALQPFPLNSLPPVLGDYLQAVADYVQVYPEMAVLPMLSVLSLCVQGKAVVKYPGNNHIEQLNLYTMTVAAPGERKSGCFKEFMRPVDAYQRRWNDAHKIEIEEYRTKKAFLERRKLDAMNQKNASESKAMEITRELLELETKHELRLNVNDVTPEALAWEMFLQGGRIGVMDDEGSVFDVLSGMYTGGTANINIFLKAYDGSDYTIVRRTKEDINLTNPLLTMGIMTQPEHFAEAINNHQFSGRGFIHRFLFSFPESKAGYQSFTSQNIPDSLRKQYADMVDRLLQQPYPNEIPIIGCDRDAFAMLNDYFEHIQTEMRDGGLFENLKEWASKQFARCLKIAGILHMCEHDPTELISGKTAMNAISISMWCENHALKAFSGGIADSQEIKDAKYILGRIKKQRDKKLVLTKHELLRLCRSLTADEIKEPLQLLEDMGYVEQTTNVTVSRGRNKESIRINPIVYFNA